MASRRRVRNLLNRSRVSGGPWRTQNVQTDTSNLGRTEKVNLAAYQPQQITRDFSLKNDASYEDQIADANYKYNTGLADLRKAQDQARYDFGLDGDTRNPFSRANQIKQGWERGKTRNTNSYASMGQLYSGALDRAQSEADRSYTEEDNSLQTQYRRLMEGYADQEREIGEQNKLAQDSARRALVERQAAERAAAQASQTPAAAPDTSPGPLGTPPARSSGGGLRSYVKNGWFYREASDGSGKMLRIRRAS